MGGLTITLHFIAPNIIKIIRKIYNKCKSNTKITSVPAPFWYHNKILKLYVLYVLYQKDKVYSFDYKGILKGANKCF